MSITPGLLKSVNLIPDVALNYVEKITAVANPGVSGTVLYDAVSANNFTFQYVAQNFTGASTYVAICLLAALDGVNFSPVTLPWSPATVGNFTEYTLGGDSFKIPRAGFKTGVIILPNQYCRVKMLVYTDVDTADVYILRSSPSIS